MTKTVARVRQNERLAVEGGGPVRTRPFPTINDVLGRHVGDEELALLAEGIPLTGVHSGEPMYLQEMFQHKQVFGTSHYPFDYAGRSVDDVDYRRGLCPVAEELTDPTRSRSFLLPCNEGVTDEDALEMADAVRKVAQHYAR